MNTIADERRRQRVIKIVDDLWGSMARDDEGEQVGDDLIFAYASSGFGVACVEQ